MAYKKFNQKYILNEDAHLYTLASEFISNNQRMWAK